MHTLRFLELRARDGDYAFFSATLFQTTLQTVGNSVSNGSSGVVLGIWYIAGQVKYTCTRSIRLVQALYCSSSTQGSDPKYASICLFVGLSRFFLSHWKHMPMVHYLRRLRQRSRCRYSYGRSFLFYSKAYVKATFVMDSTIFEQKSCTTFRRTLLTHFETRWIKTRIVKLESLNMCNQSDYTKGASGSNLASIPCLL